MAVDFEVWSGLDLPASRRHLQEVGWEGESSQGWAELTAQTLGDFTGPIVLARQPTKVEIEEMERRRRPKRPVMDRAAAMGEFVRAMERISGGKVHPAAEASHRRALAPLGVDRGNGLDRKPIFRGGDVTETALRQLAKHTAERTAEERRTTREAGDKAKRRQNRDDTYCGVWQPKYDEEKRRVQAQRWETGADGRHNLETEGAKLVRCSKCYVERRAAVAKDFFDKWRCPGGPYLTAKKEKKTAGAAEAESSDGEEEPEAKRRRRGEAHADKTEQKAKRGAAATKDVNKEGKEAKGKRARTATGTGRGRGSPEARRK
jgi:hypothetical protein